MLRFIILIALLGSPVLADNLFKQIIDGASVRIGSGPQSYALSTPELKQFNWASIYINGDRMSIVTPECQIIQRDESSLGADEKRLLESVSKRFQQVDSHRYSNGGSFSLIQSMEGWSMVAFNDVECWIKRSSIESNGINTQTVNGMRLISVGEKHYAFGRDNFPDNIKWIVVSGDLVSLVHSDGRTEMKPRSCLDESKRQLLESLETEMVKQQEMSEAELKERQERLERRRREKDAERQRRYQRRQELQEQKEQQRQQEQEQKEQQRQQKWQQKQQQRQQGLDSQSDEIDKELELRRERRLKERQLRDEQRREARGF